MGDFRTEEARQEARRSAAADETIDLRDPGDIDDDDMKAAEGLTAPPGVAEAYRESTERGAKAKGEGRIP